MGKSFCTTSEKILRSLVSMAAKSVYRGAFELNGYKNKQKNDLLNKTNSTVRNVYLCLWIRIIAPASWMKKKEKCAIASRAAELLGLLDFSVPRSLCSLVFIFFLLCCQPQCKTSTHH